jgi:hypothetical protein
LEKVQTEPHGLLQRLFHPKSILDNSAEGDSDASYLSSGYGNSNSIHLNQDMPPHATISMIHYSFIDWSEYTTPDKPFCSKKIDVFPAPLYYSSLLGLANSMAAVNWSRSQHGVRRRTVSNSAPSCLISWQCISGCHAA